MERRSSRKTLSQGDQAPINSLKDEFDALLAQMQTPEARRVMRAGFRASPKEIGRAAVQFASE